MKGSSNKSLILTLITKYKGKNYLKHWPILELYRINYIVDSIVTRNCRLVLDCGCADGTYSYIMLNLGIGVIGLDLRKEVLIKAKDKLKNMEFYPILADVQHLPLKKASLECIVAGELIEHLPNSYSFLKEAFLSLRYRGFLIISTPNRVGLWELMSRLKHDLSKIRQKPVHGCSNASVVRHISLFTLEDLLICLTKAGFKVNKVQSEGLDIVTIIQSICTFINLKLKFQFVEAMANLEIKLSEKIKPFQRGWIIIGVKE